MAKGYTKLDNDVLSAMAQLDLTASEFRVLLAIIRSTIGFQKSQWEMSNSYLSKATGLNNRSVIRAIQTLSDRGIITVLSDHFGPKPRLIRFNSDKLVMMTGIVANSDKPVTINSDNPVTQKKKDIKKDNKKENIKRKVNSFTKMEQHEVDWDAIADQLDAAFAAEPERGEK